MDVIPEDEHSAVDEFIEFAWDDAEHGDITTSNYSTFAVDACKQLLEEVVAADMRDALLKDGKLPTSLPDMLRDRQDQLDVIGSLTGVHLDVPFPVGWDQRKDVQLFTTGVSALDSLTGGGWMAGEVILFLGPYGSCKTTMACNGISTLINHAAALYATGESKRDKDDKPMIPVVVLVFTESDKNEYRNRIMSNLGRVPWTRLAQMTAVSSLDSSDMPGGCEETAYENKEFGDDAAKVKKYVFRNEQQRVQKNVRLANKHLLMIDCTDSEDAPHQIGKGGMVEIANIVRAEFRRRKGQYPLAFVVDHISALADRMSEGVEEKENDKLHLILKRIPRQAADKLAKPWKAPVLLLHQFSGEANLRKATARFHHADSAGSKSVGEYVTFAVVTGPVDENNLCRWEATKHRRTPAVPHRVVRVVGQFNRLIDVTDEYAIDYGRQVIVSKKELATYENVDKTKKGGDGYGGISVV